MGQTIAEKILSKHAGHQVKPGELIISDIDVVMVQDGTGPLAVNEFKKMGKDKLFNPDRTILFIDHAAPSPRKELSNTHIVLRDFANEYGAVLSEVGEGVCHQRLVENFVNPGEVLLGADSHTCTSGALGAFATGVGSTDIAVVMALGKTWLKVPFTYKIIIEGAFQKGVYAKDLILYLIGLIGADGATYKSLEFTGSAVKNMSMSDRFTISNMAVEAGAKVGLFETDEKTKEYLKECGREDKFAEIKADADAEYERVIKINLDELKPMISLPHTVDNTKTIEEMPKVNVNQVYIGTCTNGRIEDLRIASKILKNNHVKEGVRLLVAPASRKVFLKALEEGLITDLVNAGASIVTSGCGACVGVHAGILGDSEVCLSSQNRNFQGRMGNTEGFIYLSSPATCAYSAIKGYIADVREVL